MHSLGRRLFSSLLLLCALQPGMAGTVYRWIDASGTVNFSEEPPPAELAAEYDEISSELRAIHIRVDKEPNRSAEPVEFKQAPAAKPTETTEERSKPKQEPGEALLRKNYCSNLSKQLQKLEARLPHLEDAEQLDQVVLTIKSYEESLTESCN